MCSIRAWLGCLGRERTDDEHESKSHGQDKRPQHEPVIDTNLVASHSQMAVKTKKDGDGRQY